MKSLLAALLASLSGLLDAILPPRKRKLHTERLSLSDISLVPTAHDILGVRIVTLMNYETEVARDLVQSLKYDGSGASSRLCATLVAEYLMEEIGADSRFSTQKILLIPLPLHTSRAHERGYNQIELVLDALPKEYRDGTKSSLAKDILVRTRETKPQTKLSRSERLSNVAGAFALAKNASVRNTHIYIIDDVATTGATLANAATPLRRAGAQVSLVALARA